MKQLIAFLFGAIVGGGVTYLALNSKFNKEVAAITEAVSYITDKKEIKETKETKEEKHEIKKEGEKIKTELMKEYSKIVVNYNKPGQVEDEDDEKPRMMSPVKIDEDEFAENELYGVATYTYYADDILTDEYDNIIIEDDWDDIVGLDMINDLKAGEDMVLIRNDRIEMYIELVRSLEKRDDFYNRRNE